MTKINWFNKTVQPILPPPNNPMITSVLLASAATNIEKIDKFFLTDPFEFLPKCFFRTTQKAFFSGPCPFPPSPNSKRHSLLLMKARFVEHSFLVLAGKINNCNKNIENWGALKQYKFENRPKVTYSCSLWRQGEKRCQKKRASGIHMLCFVKIFRLMAVLKNDT